MGSLSNYAEEKWLEHVLKVEAFTSPTTVYLALSTADPLDDGSGKAEPSTGAYARKAITFGAAASRSIANSAVVTFDQATASWGTITHFAIMDNSSGGNMLAHGQLEQSKSIASGNTASVAIGEITISVSSGGMSTYLANELLDHTFRNSAYAVPTHIYVGLSIGNPTDDGSGISEPPDEASIGTSASEYDRAMHDNWNGAAAVSDGYQECSNNGLIAWSDSTSAGAIAPGSSWSLISYVFLTEDDWPTDPATHMLFYVAINTPQTPGVGDTVAFASGALKIRLR